MTAFNKGGAPWTAFVAALITCQSALTQGCVVEITALTAPTF